MSKRSERTRARLGMLCALAVLTTAATGGAQVPVGEASATGVTLTIDSRSLTIGVAEATAELQPTVDGCAPGATACAGAAVLSPPDGQMIAVHSAQGPQTQDTEQFSIPGPLSQRLSASATAATAAAAGDPQPSASAQSGQVTIALTVEGVLPADAARLRGLLEDLAERFDDSDTAGGLLDRALAALSDVVGGVADAPLAAIDVGAASAEAAGADGRMTASAATAPVALSVAPALPGLGAAAEGLVVLDVGAATATAVHGADGARAQADAPGIRARVFNPVTGRYAEATLDPADGPDCIGSPPLRVCAERGGITEVSEGDAAAATAGGVTITALQPPLPEIVLEIGMAEASVRTAAAEGRRWTAAAAAVLIALLAAAAVALGWRQVRRRRATQEPDAPETMDAAGSAPE